MIQKDVDKTLQEALQVLRAGGVMLYPTDTVWDIGCDATDPAAVARVYAIKQRSEAKSLVLLASGLDMVARYVRQIPPMASISGIPSGRIPVGPSVWLESPGQCSGISVSAYKPCHICVRPAFPAPVSRSWRR